MLAVAVRSSVSGQRELSIEKFPQPKLSAGEALLRVTLAGICGTDLEILSGYKPLSGALILGHEFLAEVVSYASDVPEQLRLVPGTRVVAEINCVASGSTSCTPAQRAQDPARTAIGIFGRHGAFAEQIAVPAVNLHPVPDGVPDDAAVFAEPIAACCQIFEQIKVPHSAKIAVLGAGRMGWLVGHVLSACGSDVTMLSRGRNNERDRRLAECFDVAFENVGKRERVDTFDVVVECTGNATGMSTALRLVRPRGTIVLKTTTAPGSGEAVDLSPVAVKEITIVGCRCGPFPAALRLLRKGLVDPRPLVDAIYERKDAVEAFARSSKRGVLKVLLK